MNIPQRKLEALGVLAQKGHFGQAAMALRISQPTLSRHVQELEESLGFQIFDRHTRSVSLTPLGEEVVAYAKNLLAFQTRAAQRITARRKGYSGHVVIAALPSFIGHFIAPLLQEIRRTRPELLIEVLDQPSQRIRETVLMERADIGLDSPADITFEGFTAQRFGFDTLSLVVSKSHPLAKRARVHVSELVDHDLIGTTPGTSLRYLTDQTFAKHDLVFKPRQEFHQVISVLGLLEADLGAAILPASALHTIPASCNEVKLAEAAKRTIWIFRKEHQPFDPAIDHVMSVMNTLAEQPKA